MAGLAGRGLAGRLLTVFLNLPGAALLTRVRAARDAARNRTKADAFAQVVTATVAGGGRREQLEALRYARAALDEFVLRSAPAVAASVTALTGRLADAEADRTGAAGCTGAPAGRHAVLVGGLPGAGGGLG